MCTHIFYEPVLGFGFFFVAARNTNIFGHSFILERERGKRVLHDGTIYRKGRSRAHSSRVNSPGCLSVLVDAEKNIKTLVDLPGNLNFTGSTEKGSFAFLGRKALSSRCFIVVRTVLREQEA